MNPFRKLFRPRVTVTTFERKRIDARRRVHKTTDRLRREMNLKPIDWKRGRA